MKMSKFSKNHVFKKALQKNLRPSWKQSTSGIGLPNTLHKTLRNRFLSSGLIFDIRALEKVKTSEIVPKTDEIVPKFIELGRKYYENVEIFEKS